MANLTCTLKSKVLGKETTFCAILPDERTCEEIPVLYLLHGLSDSYATWTKYTSIERYVRGKQLAVIMPDADRSFYCDAHFGLKYYTFIAEELPEWVQKNFYISKKREETFVAGLSMGGYGAFRLALSKPDRYAAAGAFSGALDLVEIASGENAKFFEPLYGVGFDIKDSEHDLFHLAKLASKAAYKPRLYQWCGTEDFLYEHNLKFRDYIATLGFDYTYAEGPGDHNWQYWDEQIQKFLKFIGY